MSTKSEFTASGTNANALFSLKIFRGEGMCLLGMNWLHGLPPTNFVGFAIEYKEPGGTIFFALKNRLSFLDNKGNVNPNILSTRLSPIQKFRWVHFPFHVNIPGDYTYRVTPVFMDTRGVLSYGDFQEAKIQLLSDTYPGLLNVTFTRGFIASQAFADTFQSGNAKDPLLPAKANDGLTFVSKNPKLKIALEWMGFEAREAILDILDTAILDKTAKVRVTAYDFNEPEVVSRLVKLGTRLKVIIDDSKEHKSKSSAEGQAEKMLIASAGQQNVQRQHVGGLQHNKTIAVEGNTIKAVICGSTNLSWRGFFIQNNNAIIMYGSTPVQLFLDAFDNLWNNKNKPTGFAATNSAKWNDLGLQNIKAKIAFSPHDNSNTILDVIATDIGNHTTSSLLYSLAFLYETPGSVLDSIKKITANNNIFVYGISDKTVGGLDIQRPDGNLPIAFPDNLLEKVPQPFKKEITGGRGARVHHKFVVIDFDKPTARVYMGSYNFSKAADQSNGENLLLIQDQKIATSYMIQAVAMFDHYEFRNLVSKAKKAPEKLYLQLPPKNEDEKPWWSEHFSNAQKIRDRELFS